MKERYIKPQLHIEYFALSQSVATSCGYTDEKYDGKPTHAEKGACGWKVDGVTYWTAQPACDDAYREDLEIGEVCYNQPNGAPMIFAS